MAPRWIALLGLITACVPSTVDLGDDSDTDSDSQATGDSVAIVTDLGEFVVELAIDDAPITTANFLAYVDAGFYDGGDGDGATVIHRVAVGFVIQGGGQRADGSAKTTNDPIVNESDNGLSNLRGTIAMARTDDPNSATSQWYVNLADNTGLDGGGAPTGYAVFGSVTSGMDVVDAIAAVPLNGESPVTPIPLTTVERR